MSTVTADQTLGVIPRSTALWLPAHQLLAGDIVVRQHMLRRLLFRALDYTDQGQHHTVWAVATLDSGSTARHVFVNDHVTTYMILRPTPRFI